MEILRRSGDGKPNPREGLGKGGGVCGWGRRRHGGGRGDELQQSSSLPFEAAYFKRLITIMRRLGG